MNQKYMRVIDLAKCLEQVATHLQKLSPAANSFVCRKSAPGGIDRLCVELSVSKTRPNVLRLNFLCESVEVNIDGDGSVVTDGVNVYIESDGVSVPVVAIDSDSYRTTDLWQPLVSGQVDGPAPKAE